MEGTPSVLASSRHTTVENLFLLTRGAIPSEPRELILRPRTGELLEEARAEYDYVIIDSAPVLAADDTTSLAPEVDRVICVARLGFTASRLTFRALELLKQRHTEILGVVLSCADVGPDRYYYQYKGYLGPVPARQRSDLASDVSAGRASIRYTAEVLPRARPRWRVK